ncbi:MAG: hypothetical protein ONB46_11560 [candidate division KSB1 bacterium]|nr:hypothetical protein [candidate division KSB1 bacterium]MDZ7366633.1 hypothetical protein [candidate division KSB1 bacterium]MDZ7404644.1 hypothetical protein [candidate division KSB1 bacterium]
MIDEHDGRAGAEPLIGAAQREGLSAIPSKAFAPNVDAAVSGVKNRSAQRESPGEVFQHVSDSATTRKTIYQTRYPALEFSYLELPDCMGDNLTLIRCKKFLHRST